MNVIYHNYDINKIFHAFTTQLLVAKLSESLFSGHIFLIVYLLTVFATMGETLTLLTITAFYDKSVRQK